MNSAKPNTKCCHFCNAEEGKPRPVGNFIVKLKQVDVLGTRKLACQTCFRKTVRILNTENNTTMKNPMLHRLQKLSLRIAGLFVILMITSVVLFAQGPPGLPGFPDDPEAAPIDGGLGLLAAAGGAYAIKKLRSKNEDELD